MVGTESVVEDHKFFRSKESPNFCAVEGCGKSWILHSINQLATSEAEIAFGAYAEAVQALVRVKDKAYGGAWQKQGYMGNLARIMSKTERLKSLLWSDNTGDLSGGEEVHQHYEAITDTLKDLMALAAFCAANIEDGNRWGK